MFNKQRQNTEKLQKSNYMHLKLYQGESFFEVIFIKKHLVHLFKFQMWIAAQNVPRKIQSHPLSSLPKISISCVKMYPPVIPPLKWRSRNLLPGCSLGPTKVLGCRLRSKNSHLHVTSYAPNTSYQPDFRSLLNKTPLEKFPASHQPW